MTIITNFFKSIFDFLAEVGKAKAAAELARAGYYKEAQNLLNS